jgi:hypothetical protein
MRDSALTDYHPDRSSIFPDFGAFSISFPCQTCSWRSDRYESAGPGFVRRRQSHVFSYRVYGGASGRLFPRECEGRS